MAALAPPVAAVRLAVRRALTGLPGDGPVLVACSGGADSLALAAATAFVAPRLGRRAGLVTVDHGLQPGSAERAEAVARWARERGLDPVEAVPVRVDGRTGGPEAAAREARYEALVGAGHRHSAAAVLLGHTRDDQAETVLLALARGAGPRGLAGMPERRELAGVPLLRPLLDVSREDTRKACAALGLTPWDDPHNADPAYARARVRADVLPALVRALGPGVVDNLARTARLVAADTAALDALAAAALAAPAPVEPAAGAAASGPEPSARAEVRPGAAPTPAGGSAPAPSSTDGATVIRPVRAAEGGLSVAALAALPAAVRTRVLHAWARGLGASPGALSHRHVAALDALVTDWHGQGPVHLPGGLPVIRRDGRLTT
ncbi:tRNA lysidine(34) synthetase TilS [Micromonospora sp. DR5-3]|uniref:tRNA lysidine(34) synthetase TilS n=1 Tax=unclassified Micromonospora TaxID=2617518 RepID=UPI0011D5CFC2|nr:MULTISPECIES: tRNA lysidine(34) synthetase TilS [unclassified Micromonospora]MCW3813134.1 tRNA lysidine(34) synthetase TilS [Micromonospora sp. DR5-3]TYC25888.1 tRNA lysidine(34) synthetase TilS [Micromonospora sp. MP36]